jgi:hypothetical protein
LELISAKVHGWAALRIAVFRRDMRCVATQERVFGKDVATDLCSGPVEFDHIRHGLAGRRIDDEAHGITVCAWHHRGSGWRVDAKDRRAAARRYLANLYPDVWKDVWRGLADRA